MEPNKIDKIPGTVVIADFAERRARELVREEPVAADTLDVGTKLGRYLILERLGGGGMGVVYKALDTELQRMVALKILPPHLCRQPDYHNRFHAEAQAQARLNSPHVVTLYSLLELPAGEVLVLEYVEGQTLEQRLKSAGPLKPEAAVRIFDQALRAVEHVHAAGVVHRDLKPGNIFLTRAGARQNPRADQVKLMDFGVAKIMDQADQGASRAMVGTLLYISPEQINGHHTDFRSDIYTLGVSLFETVTGRLPFERRTDYALMHAHVQERPPRPKEFQRHVPAALEWVILKAIEKDPNRRFQSATEFRRSLLRLGLIERRHRRPFAQPGLAADLLDEIFPKRRELGKAPPRLRGLWFDAALIAVVVSLVYTLGLYPMKSPVAASTVTETLDTPKAPAAAVKLPLPRAPASTPKPSSPKSPTDKYESLRNAWGG